MRVGPDPNPLFLPTVSVCVALFTELLLMPSVVTSIFFISKPQTAPTRACMDSFALQVVVGELAALVPELVGQLGVAAERGVLCVECVC